MWCSALAAAVLLGAPAAWAQEPPQENVEIRAFHDAFFAAWNRGDLDALTDSLTTDTVYHPMNGTTLTGRATLARVYGEFLANFQVTMTVHAELLQATGPQGVMMGLYRATMAPRDGRPAAVRGGRYYMALVQEADGQWRIARELTQPTGDDLVAALGPPATPPPAPGSVRVKRRFADLPEGQVHYWQGGPTDTARTPLLFLHPGPHSARVQVRLLDVLAESRPVYAPDIMGMGDSAPPPEGAVPELDYFADALHRFALAVGLEQFDVYGSNLSARIGVEMALQRPARVRRLILNRIAFMEGDELARWASHHVPEVTPDQSGAYVTFLWSRLRDLNTYVPWFEKGADNLRGRGLPPAEILHVAFVEQLKMAPTMHLAFDAYWRYPIRDRLPLLTVPTLARDDVVQLVPGAREWTPVIRGNVIEADADNLRAFAAQITGYLDDAL
jgi:uncharacterized protein (TIGR02246 family)